jgi:TP901 family phage tail tape measure protein
MANTVNITVGADTGTAEKNIGGLRGKIGGLAKPVAVASAAVTGMAVAAVKLGDEFKEAENTIRAGTGATGEDLEELTASFQEVFKGVPNDSQAVSTAIADLNTELGLQGKELENASKAFLDLSRVTGSDVAPMIKAVSDSMVQFGIPATEVENQLDKLVVASQAVGVPLEQLSNTVGKFAPQLKTMGLSMDESTALIASMEAAGLETTRMFPGLNTAMKKMSDAGVTDLSAGLSELMADIKNTESDTDALAKAQEAFGASAGIRFADAIRSGAMEIDDLLVAMNNAEGTVDDLGKSTLTTANKFDIMKNRVKSALAPIGGFATNVGPLIMIIPAVTTAVTGLSGAMAGLNLALGPILIAILAVTAAVIAGIIIWKNWGKITEFIAPAIDFIKIKFQELKDILTIVGEFFISVWTSVKDTFMTITGAIFDAYDSNLGWLLPGGALIKAIEYIWERWDHIWAAISVISQVIFEKLTELFKEHFGWLLPGGALHNALNAIRDVFIEIWDKISGHFSTVVEGIETVANKILQAFNAIKDPLVEIFNEIQGKFSEMFDKLLEFITPFLEKFKTAWGEITDAMTAPLNTVIDLVNSLIEKLNNFKIEGKFLRGIQIFPEIDPFDFAKIPALAEGGIVTKPTLAMIGESGTEAVVPLNGRGPGFGGVTVNVHMPPGGTVILDDEQTAQKFGDFITRQVRQVLRTQGAF